MELAQIAAAFAILLVAAFAQAVSGFGFSLVAVPLLALVSGPRAAVVGSSMVAVLLTSVTALHDRGFVRWRTVARVLVAAVVGMPLGLLALTALPARVLTVGIALVVLVFTLMTWRGFRVPGGVATTAVVGLVCGALTTSIGVNGPPLVAAFQAMEFPPRPFRATLAAVFAGCGTIGVLGFAVTGHVNRSVGTVALVGVPAVLAGWYLGNKIFALVSVARFRLIVLGGLIAASVVTLATALA
ncbi:sulfite exporter TauE/SafE family protein [Planosporangium mesophilum]|uniref:Probable membrane transporter protein n=1 Tax=Planosporangium mesophilum TaxID=689768 RepID=A0A8J3TDM5_9ACTN|nr:sulfite exporter TauE/SafE family protein [Planosporangium mesophilum]NJC84618.1 sulfite exporter TauE/SafE family protein [Planosporangium mesophilum]GII23927.1 hypothetical protein Pme01_35240 [Planosporangium mesophilum]